MIRTIIGLSIMLRLFLSAEVAAENVWTSGGPYGGAVNSLAVSPSEQDVIYAGTGNGIFKSIDGGATWTASGLGGEPVYVVCVAPGNASVVYAGTGHGICRSEDGGNTWILKGLSDQRVNAVAVNPGDADLLFAGTGEPGMTVQGENPAICKSPDGGETWTTYGSSSYDAVRALLIDTNDASVVYAGIDVYSGWGFLKSADGGDTWHWKQIGSVWPLRVFALAMTPAGAGSAVYAMLSGDVHRSEDQGETWTATNTPPMGRPGNLTVDPNNPDTVYVGTTYKDGYVYKSTDGGGSWSVKANGLPHSLPESIVVDPQTGHLYAGLSEGGIYKSTDGAENWVFSSCGLTHVFVESLAVDPTDSETVFAALQGDGHYLAKSTNAGAAWVYLRSSPTDLGAVSVDAQNPSHLWVGDGMRGSYSPCSAYFSLDGGQNWTERAFLHYDGYQYTGVTHILIHAQEPGFVLVGNRYAVFGSSISGVGVLARSLDSGATWSNLGGSTTALAADPDDPNIVYRGKARENQVFQLADVWGDYGGTEITPPGMGEVQDIALDSAAFVYVAADNGLWKWDGVEWETLGGLPDGGISAIAIDRSMNADTIYAGTEARGVFVSANAGHDWKDFNAGLTNLSITVLVMSSTEPKTIYAGTSGSGVWSRFPPSYLPGDTDGDGCVGIDDLILTLGLLSGITPAPEVNAYGDTNADDRIGMEDAIHIAETIARLR